jgi:branched-chain amino acid transport system substrate-binding protein
MRPYLETTGKIMNFVRATIVTLAISAAHAQTPDTIRIGFASPLTGAQAHYGKDNQNGAQMAIDDLNARGVRSAARR